MLDLFVTLFLSAVVLVCCSGFYYYGQTLEQQIKQIESDVVEVRMALKEYQFAASVVRKTRAENRALDEKLAKAYKLKRRKR